MNDDKVAEIEALRAELRSMKRVTLFEIDHSERDYSITLQIRPLHRLQFFAHDETQAHQLLADMRRIAGEVRMRWGIL